MTAERGSATGRRVLVVEDDFQIASLLAMVFEAHGAEIVGPTATVNDALVLIADDNRIDGAVLDVNLRNQTAYPIADVLQSKGVPIVFLTGYDQCAVTARYASVPCLQKPVRADRLIKALFG